MLVLAGCGLFESRASRALRASPDYKAGYSDGCGEAAASDARHDDSRRDDESYQSSRAYRAGYGAGRSACRNLGGGDRTGGASSVGRMVNPGAP